MVLASSLSVRHKFLRHKFPVESEVAVSSSTFLAISDRGRLYMTRQIIRDICIFLAPERYSALGCTVPRLPVLTRKHMDAAQFFFSGLMRCKDSACSQVATRSKHSIPKVGATNALKQPSDILFILYFA
jgi:hypothetical protein